jgi:DNA invertase Pin-like site-specific DNA recombinase
MRQSKALLYVRVSTKKQEVFGVSLEAQERTLIAEAEKRGLPYEVINEGGRSGKSVKARPELLRALEMLDKGEASHLLTIKVERVARSLINFMELQERARRKGWALIALDLAIDTSTPVGNFMSTMYAGIAQLERELTGIRTKEALAELKKQGVRLGRPSTIKTETLHYIKSLRSKGFTLLQIAEQLNREQVKTAHNGLKWYASTVSKALQSQALVNK